MILANLTTCTSELWYAVRKQRLPRSSDFTCIVHEGKNIPNKIKVDWNELVDCHPKIKTR